MQFWGHPLEVPVKRQMFPPRTESSAISAFVVVLRPFLSLTGYPTSARMVRASVVLVEGLLQSPIWFEQCCRRRAPCRRHFPHPRVQRIVCARRRRFISRGLRDSVKNTKGRAFYRNAHWRETTRTNTYYPLYGFGSDHPVNLLRNPLVEVSLNKAPLLDGAGSHLADLSHGRLTFFVGAWRSSNSYAFYFSKSNFALPSAAGWFQTSLLLSGYTNDWEIVDSQPSPPGQPDEQPGRVTFPLISLLRSAQQWGFAIAGATGKPSGWLGFDELWLRLPPAIPIRLSNPQRAGNQFSLDIVSMEVQEQGLGWEVELDIVVADKVKQGQQQLRKCEYPVLLAPLIGSEKWIFNVDEDPPATTPHSLFVWIEKKL